MSIGLAASFPSTRFARRPRRRRATTARVATRASATMRASAARANARARGAIDARGTRRRRRREGGGGGARASARRRAGAIGTRATAGEGAGETRGSDEDADAAREARREARRRTGGRGETRGDGASASGTRAGDEEGEDARAANEKWMEILKEESARDPEIAALLEGANGDPKAVEAKIRERFEQKKAKIYQERSGSTVPTLVRFREVNPFNCWIWVESHNAIAEMEKPLFEEVFKAWFVLGKLGGFNSYNMQAGENFDSVSFMDYSMEQAHEFSTDTSSHVFHEMSEVEYKAEWARVWVDLGTADEMAFDVLINSLIQFSREYFGLKQVIVGGVNEDWTTEGSEYGDVDLMVDETFGRGPRGRLGSSR